MSDDKHDINLECSFCGKKRNDVRKLIAGPDAYICNECVSISNKIINEEFYDDDLGIFEPPTTNKYKRHSNGVIGVNF